MTATGGALAPRSQLDVQVVRGGLHAVPDVATFHWPSVTDDRSRLDLSAVRAYGLPGSKLPEAVSQWRTRNVPNLWRGARRAMAAKFLGVPTMFGALWVSKVDGETGDVVPLGLVSLRVITDAGVAALVDAFTNTFEVETFNFHGMGTSNTAEAVGQTALGTELTTEYNPNSTRATGTQSQPSANVYRTVGTNTIDSGTPAVVEHGLLSQAATGGGTLWDRSVFAAINLVGANGDGIQFTYDATFTSGG